MMLCIIRHETDPYFNLAAEEYALTGLASDCFMLWRNAPAVIVGRHQNTLAEIDSDYVLAHHIPVVRRLSGGGAVFHDLGNLNFTFTTAATDNQARIDFRRFSQPILDVLRSMGVPAVFEGRNDLVIDGRKFSGNAQYIHGGRILHHGTLLFAARMADISAALRPNPAKFVDKAVKSVRSRVTNISEHLPAPMTVLEFRDRVMAHVMAATPGAQAYRFSEADTGAIEQLRDGKYRTWEWNFGHSPAYNFRKSARTAGGTLEVALEVSGGIIAAARFYGDFFNRRDPQEVAAALVGASHQEQALRARLAGVAVEEYFHNVTGEELLCVLV